MTDIWVTKYALSTGITKCIAEVRQDGISAKTFGEKGWDIRYHYGNNWQPSRELAIADAQRRQAAKIASLKKQIAKLEALTFESTPE